MYAGHIKMHNGPHMASGPDVVQVSSKCITLFSRTISTYKVSRQTIYEKLGKTSRTVDSELESQIEVLRDTQRKYSNILRLARALTSHLYHVIQTQVKISSFKFPKWLRKYLFRSTKHHCSKIWKMSVKILFILNISNFFPERFGRMFRRFGSQVSWASRGISLQFWDPKEPSKHFV